MQPIDRVLETILYVDDLDAAERFYGEVLGLELDSRKDGLFVFFRCGDGMLLLFEPEAASTGRNVPAHGARGPGHACFAVAEDALPAWQAAPERRRRRDRAGGELAARRPLVLLPRSRRQQPRAGDPADLGPARGRGPGLSGARAWSASAPVLQSARAQEETRMTGTATRPPLEVGLIADLACPWCHLGLVRLDRARAMRPQLPVRLRWWPFFLNPQLPPEGIDRQTYLRAKFGGEAAAQGRLRADRRERPGRWRRVRLRADDPHPQHPARPPPDPARGRAGPRRSGDPRPVRGPVRRGPRHRRPRRAGRDRRGGRARPVRGLILPRRRSRCGARCVASHRRAERLGVRGVPVFVFDDEHVVSGAQPPEVLVRLLDLAASAA